MPARGSKDSRILKPRDASRIKVPWRFGRPSERQLASGSRARRSVSSAKKPSASISWITMALAGRGRRGPTSRPRCGRACARPGSRSRRGSRGRRTARVAAARRSCRGRAAARRGGRGGSGRRRCRTRAGPRPRRLTACRAPRIAAQARGRHQGLVGHVQAEHHERDAGLEHHLRGVRVDVDVELGGGRDVALADGAAHQHDLADAADDVGRLVQRQRELVSGPSVQSVTLPAGRARSSSISASTACAVGERRRRRRQVGAIQAGRAVDVLGGDRRRARAAARSRRGPAGRAARRARPPCARSPRSAPAARCRRPR